MASIYSKQFVLGVATVGHSPSATVPPGVVWIVRDIVVEGITDPGSGGGIACVLSLLQLFSWFLPVNSVINRSWEGRIVLPAGATIVFAVTDAGTFNCYAGGYELTAP
jgi:hypothetical protein